MKHAFKILLFIVCTTCACNFHQIDSEPFIATDNYSGHNNENGLQPVATAESSQPLVIVYGQDVSRSIFQNGVSIEPPSIFQPYFDNTGQQIDIYYGLISGNSAQKLLHVRLLPWLISRPQVPDLKGLNIVQAHKVKVAYETRLTAYHIDSSRFFTHRALLVAQFKTAVDSLLETKSTLDTMHTDIATMTRIADKVFNSSPTNARCTAILNTDGVDSYCPQIAKLHNNAYVIVVNAHGITQTSIDSVANIVLESSELAIAYSLCQFTPKTNNYGSN